MRFLCIYSFLDPLGTHRVKTSIGSRCYSVAGPTLWNSLSDIVKSAGSLFTFQRHLKTHIFFVLCARWRLTFLYRPDFAYCYHFGTLLSLDFWEFWPIRRCIVLHCCVLCVFLKSYFLIFVQPALHILISLAPPPPTFCRLCKQIGVNTWYCTFQEQALSTIITLFKYKLQVTSAVQTIGVIRPLYQAAVMWHLRSAHIFSGFWCHTLVCQLYNKHDVDLCMFSRQKYGFAPNNCSMFAW